MAMREDEAKSGSEAKRLTQFQLQGDAAERYERWVVPFISGPWAPPLLDLLELRAGERVLDVACGTGVVSRLAARRVSPGGTVTGLDLNEGMLSVARRLPLPPSLTIDWRQGSALALPFADGAFDVVVCQHGLMFFPDRLQALGEMRRVLTPVGRVALSVWTGPSPYFTAQREGLTRYVGAEAASTSAVAFSLGDAAELGGLLKGAGFRDVVVHLVRMTLRLPAPEEFVLRHLSALPPAELIAAAGEEAHAALIAHMKDATRAYVDGYGLAVPQEVNVATGRVAA
jgi:ubiquinone/menaquinone biosynthesis C-methylase UbiE